MPKPLQHLYLFIPNFITAFKHNICLNIFHKSFAPLGKTRAELCTRSRTRTTASCESQKYVRLLSQNNENAREDFVLPKVQPLRHLRFSIQEFKAKSFSINGNILSLWVCHIMFLLSEHVYSKLFLEPPRFGSQIQAITK